MMKIKVTQLHVHFQKKIKPYQLPEKLIGGGGGGGGGWGGEYQNPHLLRKFIVGM